MLSGCDSGLRPGRLRIRPRRAVRDHRLGERADAEVAAFMFTESPNSYAERTGRPANVGVHRRRAVSRAPVAVRLGTAAPAGAHRGTHLRGARERGPRPFDQRPRLGRRVRQPGPIRVSPERPLGQGRVPAGRCGSRFQAEPQAKLGTGHGEREYSYVNHTEFARLQPQPNEIIRIRYDSLENLLAMGIVKRPRPLPPTMNPFPASPEQQYVPDPAGCDRRAAVRRAERPPGRARRGLP